MESKEKEMVINVFWGKFKLYVLEFYFEINNNSIRYDKSIFLASLRPTR